MGSIREYDNKLDIQPSSRPAEFAAQTAAGDARTSAVVGDAIGSGIGALGKPAEAVYQKYVVQSELNKGGAAGSALVNNLTQQWNDTASNSDPNDGSVAPKFREKVLEPAFENYIDSFNTAEGKQWATGQVQRYREHFDTVLNADSSSRAGTAAVINSRTTTNNLTNAAYSDPTSIDFNLTNSDEAWKAGKEHAGTDPSKAAELDAQHVLDNKEIVQAGLLGLLERNPVQFQTDLAAGKFSKYDTYLSAAEKQHLMDAAVVKQKANEADARTAATDQARQDKANADAAVNDIYLKYVEPSEDGGLHIKPGAYGAVLQLGHLPGASDTLISSVGGAMRAIENDELARVKRTSDPDVYQSFTQRAFLPSDDPNKLTITEIAQMRANNQISNSDYAFFTRAVTQKDPGITADAKAFNQWYGGVKPLIDNSSALIPGTPQAKERAAQFYRDKWDEFEELRAKGTSAADIIAAAGPKKGLLANLELYQITNSATIQNLTAGASGAVPSPQAPIAKPTPDVPARNAGESAADYLARTKGAAPEVKPPLAKGDNLAPKTKPTDFSAASGATQDQLDSAAAQLRLQLGGQ